MKSVTLQESTLSADVTDQLKLLWSPKDLTIPGIKIDTVALDVTSESLGLKASGSLAMDFDDVTCTVPGNWQNGLGQGTFKCNLSVSATAVIAVSKNKTEVQLSKLKAWVFGNQLDISGGDLIVEQEDLGDLSTKIKSYLEQGKTDLFNKFWASQVINNKQVLTEALKNKSVSLDFKSLSLPVTNDVTATAGGEALTTEKSTLTGSLNCTWKYSGVALSLNASFNILGKDSTLAVTSDSEGDLAKLSTWVTGQVDQSYHSQPKDTEWVKNIGTFLLAEGLIVADTFKKKGYSGVVAIQAVNGAHQDGAPKTLVRLYDAKYSDNDLANAMRYGLNQPAVPFAQAFYSKLGWTYRMVGVHMRDIGYSAGEIACGLDWPHHFKCKPKDIAGFLTAHCNCKAGDLDGVSSPNIALIVKHMKSGTSNNGKGFYKPPPPKGKKPGG